jgi:NAD(P)H-hydrate epimerase
MLIGLDVVSVDRVNALAARNARFLARAFTSRERADCEGHPQRLASTWAAKEAVRKLHAAAGRTIPAFADIEVMRRSEGPPHVHVRAEHIAVSLSLTHDAGVAAAVAAADADAMTASLATPVGIRLPARPDDAHKGTFGRVVVVAGSRGFTGAPLLASLGAARGGAGLVTLCVPESIYPIVATRCLEVMPAPLPDEGGGVLQRQTITALDEYIGKADALVTGPGIGRAPETADAITTLLDSVPCPAVVDADALNIVAERGHPWRRGGAPFVITPHPAEMARLTRLETAVVQSDRVNIAATYAREQGVIVVLKGSETVVAAPDGRVQVDAHRVVALATGGTGDVLAGLCGAMLAQGLDAFDAAVAAVTVHAEAGLQVQASRGRAGGLASDVLDALPQAQERIRRAIEQQALRA